ncbi:MAG: glutaredoxin family protein [Pseudomonadota bacterium]|nr:glutaredoxin family protein [Pseudomonadota bacterium]
MTSHTVDFLAPQTLLAVIALAASLASPLSQAQQVYRIVGTDGRVTFSDQPPPVGSTARTSEISAKGVGSASGAALPFALRQVAQKYPVSLYTGNNCGPCDTARTLLTTRGIPFSEKTVTTAPDSQALQRLSGDTSLPFMTIGSQQLKGFSEAEWTQFLNAAGYPATSALPANYRLPAPAPLVATAKAPTAAASAASAKNSSAKLPPVPVTPPQTSGNPSGIRF